MKSLLLSMVFVNSLLSFDYQLQPKAVGSDIYCFFGLAEVMDEHNNGNMVNSCYVAFKNHYLVVDSGPTYQYAQQAYTAMQKVKNLPVSYVINTHIHDDHWLGNSFYKEKGSILVGPTNFKDFPKNETTRMQKRVSPEAFAKTTVELPTLFVSSKKELLIDGQKVLIERVNHKAHTADDLFVYIPSKHAVFAGDLVFNERLPSLRDGNINGWIAALREIGKMDVKYIIGGHGKMVSKKSVDYTYTYLTQLRREVAQHLDAGDEIDDTVNAVVMQEYSEDPFYEAVHRQNVEQVYRTLEWESE